MDASTASIPAVTTAVPDADEKTYAQGIPPLFARYTLPEDGLRTLPAKDGRPITPTTVTQVVTRAHDVR